MSLGEVAGWVHGVRRDALTKAYEGYVENPSKYETKFWNEVIKFAKLKIYYLEGEFASVGSVNTVDDWVQEVVIDVLVGLKSFNGGSDSFYAWLHKICFTKASKFFNELLAQKQNKEPLEIDAKDEQRANKGHATDNPVIYGTDERETWITIPQSVQGTNLMICKLILEGWDYKRIAHELGLTEPSVKQRLYRLRDQMQKEKAHNKR